MRGTPLLFSRPLRDAMRPSCANSECEMCRSPCVRIRSTQQTHARLVRGSLCAADASKPTLSLYCSVLYGTVLHCTVQYVRLTPAVAPRYCTVCAMHHTLLPVSYPQIVAASITHSHAQNEDSLTSESSGDASRSKLLAADALLSPSNELQRHPEVSSHLVSRFLASLEPKCIWTVAVMYIWYRTVLYSMRS